MGYTGDKKRRYQNEWLQARRKKYMADMGNCYFCNSAENREIHHISPGEKESHKIWSWGEDRIIEELKQCIVMCRDCHSKFHAILQRKPLIHGTLHGYQKYRCRCEHCTEANRLRKRKAFAA